MRPWIGFFRKSPKRNRLIERSKSALGYVVVPSNRLQAKSLFDHLMRQGFPYELVADKVRAVSQVEVDDN